MFAHIESLVGGIDNKSIIQQSFFFQIVEHTTYIIIKRFHSFHIITHITLEFPVGKFLSLQILLIEIFYNRSIEFIPCGTLSLVHPSQKFLIKRFQAWIFIRPQHFKVVDHIHIFHDTHFLSSRCRTSFIVVKEIIRQWESFIFVQSQITSIRHPITMNSLVMNQQAERFLRVSLVFHPINGIVRYKIGDISMFLNRIIFLCDEIRIIIISLSRNDFPIIKSWR